MAGRYEAPSIDDHGDLTAGQKKAEGKEGNMPNNNLLRFIAHAHPPRVQHVKGDTISML